jgi:hypothetical protein
MSKASVRAQESGDLGECYVIKMLQTKWKFLMPFEVNTVCRHEGSAYDIEINSNTKLIKLETKRSQVNSRNDNHLFGKSLTFINEFMGWTPKDITEVEKVLKTDVFADLFLKKNDYVMFWKDGLKKNTVIVIDNETLYNILKYRHTNRIEGYFLEFNDYFRLKLRSNRVQCCFSFNDKLINFLREHALSFYEWKKN